MLVANYAQTDREGQASIAAFLDTFQRLGWNDRGNVRIEYRWGAGNAERAKAAAAELVRSAPDAIVVATSPALAELHRLTNTIPIVFIQAGDPLDAGKGRAGHGESCCFDQVAAVRNCATTCDRH